MDINYYKQYEPIFGSWKITRFIGEGSFGKVFEMEREDFGVTFKAALKAVTVPANESEVREMMDRYTDPAQMRQDLEHVDSVSPVPPAEVPSGRVWPG